MGRWGYENDPQRDGAICGRYRLRLSELQHEHQTLIQSYTRMIVAIEAQERTIAETESEINRLPNFPASKPVRGKNRRRDQFADILGGVVEAGTNSTARSLESRLQDQKNGLVRLMRQLEDIGKARDTKFEFMRHVQQQAARDGCDIDLRL